MTEHLQRSNAQRLTHAGTIGALMIAVLLAQAFTGLRGGHARSEENAVPMSGGERRVPAHWAQRGLYVNVFLAPVTIENGRPVIGSAMNVTDRSGYDGEPAFSADGHSILFTSAELGEARDLYRYEIATRTITRLTASVESELAPAVVPSARRISAIRARQEVVRIGRRRLPRDSTETLWSLSLDGSDPKPLLPSLGHVDAYAWLDANDAAVVVHGRPNALLHVDVRTGRADTLARGVWPTLTALPGRAAVGFIHTVDRAAMLSVVSWIDRRPRDVATLPPTGGQSVAWLSDDLVLAAAGGRILYRDSKSTTWLVAGDFTAAGVSGIRDVAVSADTRWVAFVAFPLPCPRAGKSVFDAAIDTPGGFEMTPSARMPAHCVFPEGR